MARCYAEVIMSRPDLVLVGFVGNGQKTCGELADRFAVSALPHANYCDFLSQNAVDAVIVATPEWVRKEPLDAIFSAGKHLLLEKPAIDSVDLLPWLLSHLERYSSVFRTCNVLRFHPKFCRGIEALQGGAVGRIKLIKAVRNSSRERVLRVFGKTDLCFWLLPHDLDLMISLVGSKAVSVQAVSGSNPLRAQDFLLIIVTFESGVTGQLEINWLSTGVSSIAPNFGWTVYGDNGCLTIDDSDNSVITYGPNDTVVGLDTEEFFMLNGMPAGYFARLIDDFSGSCQAGESNQRDISNMIEVVKICGLARKSLETGDRVFREEL